MHKAQINISTTNTTKSYKFLQIAILLYLPPQTTLVIVSLDFFKRKGMKCIVANVEMTSYKFYEKYYLSLYIKFTYIKTTGSEEAFWNVW